MQVMEAVNLLVYPGVGKRFEDGGVVSLAGHSHNIRSSMVDFAAAKRNLVEWAAENRIDAVGVGSPWEPVSAAHYMLCETTERDAYFGGLIDPESMMDREAVAALINDLNGTSAGRTFFYLDNETPKNRHGHIWYIGFDYQVPCWHDYSQDRRVQFWDGDACNDSNMLTGGCHRRRSYAEVVALQRKAGALAIWAHPTSWWRQNSAFVTNIAAEMILHLHADGFLDGITVQGYDSCHRAYQALWFYLLDRGAYVPGFAELDACFDLETIAPAGTFLNYIPGHAPVESCGQLIPGLRSAEHFVSSGPYLTLNADGFPAGTRIKSGDGFLHHFSVTAWPAPGERTLSRVEIIGRGGRLIGGTENFCGGTMEFDIPGIHDGGYVLARAFGEHDIPSNLNQKSIKHCALTNPVFFETSSSPRVTPVRTALRVNVSAGGHADGGVLSVLNAAGETMESGIITSSGAEMYISPNWRLLVEQTDGTVRDIPIAMANAAVREHIEYLADGKFLEDFGTLSPGEVPAEAYRFDGVREALAAQTILL